VQTDKNNLTGSMSKNNIELIGRIVSDFVFSHDIFGEGFLNFEIEVPRLSNTVDILPVTISERILDRDRFFIGSDVFISGQVRSYNNYIEQENRNRLVLTVFVRDIELICDDYAKNPNDVYLNGYICKPPIYRTTPFGREITDMLLAVNRSYNKSDYIPCIAWGRNARYASCLKVGDNVGIWGRMQSRVYQKKVGDDTFLEKTAYEVSISKIEQEDDYCDYPNET